MIPCRPTGKSKRGVLSNFWGQPGVLLVPFLTVLAGETREGATRPPCRRAGDVGEVGQERPMVSAEPGSFFGDFLATIACLGKASGPHRVLTEVTRRLGR